MANKFLPFVDWLWSKRDVNVTFHPGVLTSENPDKSLPTPPLSILESGDLFVLLEGKGVVFPKGKDGDFTTYSINKIESHKWMAVMRELKKSEFRYHPMWITVCSILTHILAGVVGAVFVIAGDLMKDKVKEWWKKPAAQLQTEPSTN